MKKLLFLILLFATSPILIKAAQKNVRAQNHKGIVVKFKKSADLNKIKELLESGIFPNAKYEDHDQDSKEMIIVFNRSISNGEIYRFINKLQSSTKNCVEPVDYYNPDIYNKLL